MRPRAETEENAAEAVVFLDIDGVLQPLSSQERFEHDLKALKQELVAKDPRYEALNRYDIGAVRYDWHPEAVANLKTLCARGGAKIVVSSSWRDDKPLPLLRLLLRMHDLDGLAVGETPAVGPRDLEIQEYLVSHPEIRRFVIVDDSFADTLGRRFPRQFVNTSRWLDAGALEQALSALRRRPRKRDLAALADFDALVRRDPALTRLSLDLEEMSFIQRRRGLGRHAFVRALCEGVEQGPALASLTVRGLFQESTWSERLDKKEDPIVALRQAAARNPTLHQVEIEAQGKDGFLQPNNK